MTASMHTALSILQPEPYECGLLCVPCEKLAMQDFQHIYQSTSYLIGRVSLSTAMVTAALIFINDYPYAHCEYFLGGVIDAYLSEEICLCHKPMRRT